MKTVNCSRHYLIIAFFSFNLSISGFAQNFDVEYSYEQYLNNSNFKNLIEETADTIYHQEVFENSIQKIIKISNESNGSIIYYFNKLEKDFICDSILSNYFFCDCGEDAKKYYSSNKGLYEKGYYQIENNVYIGIQGRLSVEFELFGGKNARYSKVRKLSSFQNRSKEYCVTIKREVLTMNTKDYKNMKKKLK
jgi:hypothetical protein